MGEPIPSNRWNVLNSAVKRLPFKWFQQENKEMECLQTTPTSAAIEPLALLNFCNKNIQIDWLSDVRKKRRIQLEIEIQVLH